MNTPAPILPIAERGIVKEDFDAVLAPEITTALTENEVKQKGTIGGIEYKFTIRLTRWTGRTTPAQILILSRLFWQVYPKMYSRFGAAGKSPTAITVSPSSSRSSAQGSSTMPVPSTGRASSTATTSAQRRA